MSDPLVTTCAIIGPIWAILALGFAAFIMYIHAKTLDEHDEYFKATARDLNRLSAGVRALKDRIEAIEAVELYDYRDGGVWPLQKIILSQKN